MRLFLKKDLRHEWRIFFNSFIENYDFPEKFSLSSKNAESASIIS